MKLGIIIFLVVAIIGTGGWFVWSQFFAQDMGLGETTTDVPKDMAVPLSDQKDALANRRSFTYDGVTFSLELPSGWEVKEFDNAPFESSYTTRLDSKNILKLDLIITNESRDVVAYTDYLGTVEGVNNNMLYLHASEWASGYDREGYERIYFHACQREGCYLPLDETHWLDIRIDSSEYGQPTGVDLDNPDILTVKRALQSIRVES